MLGGHRGPNEQTPVVEIRAVKDLARNRVEKRFRAFGLLVIDQQRDVLALDLGPAGVIDARAAEVEFQARNGLGDATIVEVDSIAGDVTDGKPIAGFEIFLCQPCAVAEKLVMAIEAVERCPGDGLRARGGALSANSWWPRPAP